MIQRVQSNPILIPEEVWEVGGAFNPNVIKVSDDIYKMAYRAIDDKGISHIAIADSNDGIEWQNKRILITPDTDFDKFGCEDPRITFIDNQYFIFYTAISESPASANSIKVALVISDDLTTIKEKKLITPFNAKAACLFPDKIGNKYVIALTANTDLRPSRIALAFFDNTNDFGNNDFWNEWYLHLIQNEVKLNRISTDQVEIGSVPIKTDKGWLWFYCHIRNYGISDKTVFGIEAVLTKLDEPKEILLRTDEPLMVPTENYEILGKIKNVIFPSGAIEENEFFRIYYGATDNFGAVAEINKNDLWGILEKNKIKKALKLKKSSHNPILKTIENNEWEKRAVFNPTVVYEQGKFHVLYRALSEDLVSSIGYASSDDGVNFNYRFPTPIYIARTRFERKMKNDNYSGCEDPRIVKIDDKFYIFYTTYNGVNSPRVAMSWIKIVDFLNQDWLWSSPVIISPPDLDNKDACLFPEKINGKYLMLHRADGKNIAIDWLTDLDQFSDTNWLETEGTYNKIDNSWEGEKIGVGCTPIKTERGWLVIYHGVSDIDRHYRVGAMLLDLNDPIKILARTKYPILEPTEEFERIGLVNNVVFPCGATVVNDTLYVYYGGADQAIGVATISLNELLNYLDENKL